GQGAGRRRRLAAVRQGLQVAGQARLHVDDRTAERLDTGRLQRMVGTFRVNVADLPMVEPVERDQQETVAAVHEPDGRFPLTVYHQARVAADGRLDRLEFLRVTGQAGQPEPEQLDRPRQHDRLNPREVADAGESAVGSDGQRGTDLPPALGPPVPDAPAPPPP